MKREAMICCTLIWSWPGWSALNTLATAAAAIIVAIYTRETWRLRRVAQDQLEASIAPFLMVAERSVIASPSAVQLDPTREGGKPYCLSVHNHGKGPALHPVVRYRSRPLPGALHPSLRGDEALPRVTEPRLPLGGNEEE